MWPLNTFGRDPPSIRSYSRCCTHGINRKSLKFRWWWWCSACTCASALGPYIFLMSATFSFLSPYAHMRQSHRRRHHHPEPRRRRSTRTHYRHQKCERGCSSSSSSSSLFHTHHSIYFPVVKYEQFYLLSFVCIYNLGEWRVLSFENACRRVLYSLNQTNTLIR